MRCRSEKQVRKQWIFFDFLKINTSSEKNTIPIENKPDSTSPIQLFKISTRDSTACVTAIHDLTAARLQFYFLFFTPTLHVMCHFDVLFSYSLRS